MGFHGDQDYHDDGLNEFLEWLINTGELRDAALGVTRQVIDRGIESLTAKQKEVFDVHVLGTHIIENCERCSHSIPMSEMVAAKDNGGLCGYCEHMVSKNE